jgi:multiple sugar transport system permease protein
MAILPQAHRVLSVPAARPGVAAARAGHWLVLSVVVAGALVVFFPFLWMALTSLKTAPEIQRLPLHVLPDRWLHLDNYREVFQRQPFGRFLLNSALVASVSATSSLVFSALAGYGFAKFRFPGRDVLFFTVIGILMVPFQSVVVPLYLWVNRLGLLDTYLGILAPDLVSVFGVFLMRQAMEVVPGDYIDAARIDGCGEWGIFWRVVLPMVTPALATLAIIKFMWTWNEFFWPLVVVNSPTMKVVTMGLMSFTNMYFIEYNLATAAAVLSILPILVIFLTLQRWIVRAVVISGLKG